MIFHASKQLLGPLSLEFSFGLALVALAKGNVRSKQGRFLKYSRHENDP
ncbi:MAG: hypothetical protein U5L00_00545 [Desulfovermiculus sp.]|nr:hypothetical protein [Desulfovermiculus sp.]